MAGPFSRSEFGVRVTPLSLHSYHEAYCVLFVQETMLYNNAQNLNLLDIPTC